MRKTIVALLVALVLALMASAPALAQTTNLVVTKTCDPNPVEVGQLLTCHITLTNTGDSPTADGVLFDLFPPSLQFVSITETSGPAANCFLRDGYNEALCTFDQLGAGESLQVDVVFIPTEAGTFVNGANASAYNPEGVSGSGIGYTNTEINVVNPPPRATTKDQCKYGGYADFGFSSRKECLEFVKD